MPDKEMPISSLADTPIQRRTLLVGALAAGALGSMHAVGQPLAAEAAVPFPLANPWTSYPITDTWAAHLARDSGGGIDYGLPVGTLLQAPHAGSLTLHPLWGTGGNMARITHPSGYKSELLHLTSFVGSARSVVINEVVGKSGGDPSDPGAGSSTGAHLHWHMITPGGVRIDPLPHVNTGAGAVIPPPTVEDEKGMWFSNLSQWGTPIAGVYPLGLASYLLSPNGQLRAVGQMEAGYRTGQNQPLIAIHGWNLGVMASSGGV